MIQLAFQDKFLQLLGRPRHALEPLAEGHDGKAVVHELRRDLRGVPAVDGDLPDSEAVAVLVELVPDGLIVQVGSSPDSTVADWMPLEELATLLARGYIRSLARKPHL